MLINKKTKLMFICLVLFFIFLLFRKMIRSVTLIRETIQTVSFLIRCSPTNDRYENSVIMLTFTDFYNVTLGLQIRKTIIL